MSLYGISAKKFFTVPIWADDIWNIMLVLPLRLHSLYSKACLLLYQSRQSNGVLIWDEDFRYSYKIV